MEVKFRDYTISDDAHGLYEQFGFQSKQRTPMRKQAP
jgi:hypothetical protein